MTQRGKGSWATGWGVHPRGGGGAGGFTSGGRIQRVADLPAIADPNQPHFVEDRSPIRCSLCGNVPRYPKASLDTDGTCKGKKACAERRSYFPGGLE